MKSRAFLPYGRQSLDQTDIQAVTNVLHSEFLTTGPVIEAFESYLASTVDASHAVSCSSGTAALHLAVMALSIGKGDVVIVPSITFVATANVVRLQGAEVLLCDVDPITGLVTPETLERAIGQAGTKLKAVMLVALNGQAKDFDLMIPMVQQAGGRVIIDGCHAIGGSLAGENGPHLIGSDREGVLTCFSFHPVKSIAMGEGGAVTTNDADTAEKMRSLRHHGIVRDGFTGSLKNDYDAPWYHEFHQPAYNYRASDIHCALGLSQLKKLPAFIKKRSQLVGRYQENLRHQHITLVADHAAGRPAWHLMVAHFNWDALGVSRKQLVTALKDKNIGTQVHYIPLHRQPVFEMVPFAGAVERNDSTHDHASGADQYYLSVLSLPLYAAMTNDDVDYVCNSLKELLSI